MASKSAAWLKVEKYLKNHKINYQTYGHPAVFSVAEGKKYKINVPGLGCKSLFLKAKKEGRYFLYTLPGRNRADLKGLADLLEVKKLVFASEAELWQFLKVKPGSVSPLNIINDSDKRVELLIDNQAYQAPIINVHPNDNRASITLTKEMVDRFLNSLGRPVKIIR